MKIQYIYKYSCLIFYLHTRTILETSTPFRTSTNSSVHSFDSRFVVVGNIQTQIERDINIITWNIVLAAIVLLTIVW